MRGLLTAMSLGLTLPLLACGHDATSGGNNEQAASAQTSPASPTSYDYAGSTGILVSFDADAPRYFSAEDCERAFQQASACMNLQASGPVVRVVKNPIVVNGQEYSGFTDFSSGQITLVSCSVAPHEFVHYLLWKAQFPNAQNANHVSDGFTRCGAPLNLPTTS